MGISDGVNKLWILRTNRGLDVDGYKDEIGAIDALVRQALINCGPEIKSKIEAAVAEALKHLDLVARTCNRHDDCDAADEKVRKMGRQYAEHCHDDCCEECFGS